MKLTLTIESTTGAFSEDVFPVGDEVARILHHLANQVHGTEAEFWDGVEQTLTDSDGIVVGKALFER